MDNANPSGTPPAGSSQPSTGAAAAPAASSGGLAPNIAAVLAYVFWFVAIIWLVIEPYKNDKYVRFHSFQSLFLCAAGVVLGIACSILSIILAVIHLGFLSLIFYLVYLAFFVLWLYLVFQAYSNKMYKLPIIGELAAKQAGV